MQFMTARRGETSDFSGNIPPNRLFNHKWPTLRTYADKQVFIWTYVCLINKSEEEGMN